MCSILGVRFLKHLANKGEKSRIEGWENGSSKWYITHTQRRLHKAWQKWLTEEHMVPVEIGGREVLGWGACIGSFLGRINWDWHEICGIQSYSQLGEVFTYIILRFCCIFSKFHLQIPHKVFWGIKRSFIHTARRSKDGCVRDRKCLCLF